MKIRSRGKRWRVIFVLAPLAAIAALALTTSGFFSAAAEAYVAGSSCQICDQPINASQYGLQNDMLFIANGRASNVAVVDVGSMSIADYVPIPKSPINANAAAGQLAGTLAKTLHGANLSLPVNVPDMFYWEVHGVVPSADRKSVYAIGALAMTPSDFTMYQVDTKTHNLLRSIPLAPSVVGYCGLEYNLNDESSGVLYAENMQTGPGDLAMLFGSPLQIRDPLAGLLPALGLGGLANTVENQLSLGVGGISEENLSSGTNTAFISTDWDGDGNASTCGIAWDSTGHKAYASQMFTVLTDTINWDTKTVNGEIMPIAPYIAGNQHQETSIKSRNLLITAAAANGVAVYSMDTNALVGAINIDAMVGHSVIVHGVEVSPANDNILYVTGDAAPSASTIIVDITDIRAPKLIGGINSGLDIAACGTYAISDKQDYYRAVGKCERPNLTASRIKSYWEDYTAYQNRILSVDFSLGVSDTTAANNVQITGAQNTNNVTTVTPLPYGVGDITSTSGATVTMKYSIPQGVTAFQSTLSATAQGPCGDTYNYGG